MQLILVIHYWQTLKVLNIFEQAQLTVLFFDGRQPTRFLLYYYSTVGLSTLETSYGIERGVNSCHIIMEVRNPNQANIELI